VTRCFGFSIVVHVLLAVIATIFFAGPAAKPVTKHHFIEIQGKPNEVRTHSARKSPCRTAPDLRPDFVRNRSFFSAPSGRSSVDLANDRASDRSQDGKNRSRDGISNGMSRDLLFTESKVFQVFDSLALRIDKHLDYPSSLYENGVHGIATLDLYFDGSGNVDESRSQCQGGHRSIRGILIGATRNALLEWFANEAGRITKEQFRNQHFRAEFALSTFLGDANEVTQQTLGSYSFLRRKSRQTCIAAGPGGDPALNLACVAAKAAASLKNAFDRKAHMRFVALSDTLDHYDQLGLTGINELVMKGRGLPPLGQNPSQDPVDSKADLG